MQTQTQAQTPALSKGKVIAAAGALLIGAAFLAYGVPRTANAAASFSAQPAADTASARPSCCSHRAWITASRASCG